jgi:hypothetical protein
LDDKEEAEAILRCEKSEARFEKQETRFNFVPICNIVVKNGLKNNHKGRRKYTQRRHKEKGR